MTTLKDPGAFKTIGELSDELGVAQHILRYWESKFPQLRPLQRAGNRRYYRPSDTALARRIHDLLSNQGYTIRGVQKLLGSPAELPVVAGGPPTPVDIPSVTASPVDFERLVALRDRLVTALGE